MNYRKGNALHHIYTGMEIHVVAVSEQLLGCVCLPVVESVDLWIRKVVS